MGKGEEELSRAANLCFGRHVSVLICQRPVKGRQLCVSEEVMGYLGESQTEQNHLSPAGTGRGSKTENSKCGTGRAEGRNLGLWEPTSAGGSRKAKQAGFLPHAFSLGFHPGHKAKWPLSVTSAFWR